MNEQRMERLRRPALVAGIGLFFVVVVALFFTVVATPALAQEGDDGEADSPFAANVVTTTTAANVNLRAAPGLDAEILQVVPAGTIVGFTGFMDGTGTWIQVHPVGAPVGWMHRTLLVNVPDELQVRPADQPEEEAEEVEFAENVVTGQTLFNVYLRSSPEQSFNIVQTLEAGTVVGFTGFMDGSGNWIQVDPVDGPVGWVWRDFVSNVPDGLQVRPADLPDEAEDDGDEAEADGDDQASGEEEEESPFAENVVTTTTTANVNLREAPGLDAEIIQVVPEGTIVGFTGFMDQTGQWVQVDPVGAPVGWMHSSLLAFVPDGLQVATDLD